MTAFASDFRRQPFVIEGRTSNGTKLPADHLHRFRVWLRVTVAIALYAGIIVWLFDTHETGGSQRLLQVYFFRKLIGFLPVSISYGVRSSYLQVVGFPAAVSLNKTKGWVFA